MWLLAADGQPCAIATTARRHSRARCDRPVHVTDGSDTRKDRPATGAARFVPCRSRSSTPSFASARPSPLRPMEAMKASRRDDLEDPQRTYQTSTRGFCEGPQAIPAVSRLHEHVHRGPSGGEVRWPRELAGDIRPGRCPGQTVFRSPAPPGLRDGVEVDSAWAGPRRSSFEQVSGLHGEVPGPTVPSRPGNRCR